MKEKGIRNEIRGREASKIKEEEDDEKRTYNRMMKRIKRAKGEKGSKSYKRNTDRD